MMTTIVKEELISFKKNNEEVANVYLAQTGKCYNLKTRDLCAQARKAGINYRIREEIADV